MTCGECKFFPACSVSKRWSGLLASISEVPAKTDDSADDCPCFYCERKEEKEVCAECDGTGMVRITVPAHHPRCDGSCAVGCPVPIEDVDVCPSCGGAKEEK